jgi:hypothetical protein
VIAGDGLFAEALFPGLLTAGVLLAWGLLAGLFTAGVLLAGALPAAVSFAGALLLAASGLVWFLCLVLAIMFAPAQNPHAETFSPHVLYPFVARRPFLHPRLVNLLYTKARLISGDECHLDWDSRVVVN